MQENITIAIRIRPQQQREKGQKCNIIMRDNKLTIQQPSSLKENFLQNTLRSTFTSSFDQHQVLEKVFQFYRCYWSFNQDQQKMIKNFDVYSDLGKKLIKNVFDGYNSTIFAYGQTGSGKSYTIEGQEGQEKGIIQYSLTDIYQIKQKNKIDKIETQIFVSYLEIYNEELKDLLDPQKKIIKIYSTPEGVIVHNLSKILCENLDEVTKLLNDGKKIRAVGSHSMNKQSSRSHAIFTIYIKQKFQNSQKIAKLNIVDLAGSEKQRKTEATGQFDLFRSRLLESSNINKSLTFLGLVIESLASNQTNQNKGQNMFVPYRNSQLTMILSESLCGNSKTFMIATISGGDENYEETLSTLRFAERTQIIKTKIKQNIIEEEKLQQEALVQQIKQLKLTIEQLNENNLMNTGQEFQQIKELQDKKQETEDQIKINEILLLETNESIENMRKNQKELEKQRNLILKQAGIYISDKDQKQLFKQYQQRYSIPGQSF